jgi:hypothetical protein
LITYEVNVQIKAKLLFLDFILNSCYSTRNWSYCLFISSNSPTDFVTLVSIVFNLSSSLVINWKNILLEIYNFLIDKIWKLNSDMYLGPDPRLSFIIRFVILKFWTPTLTPATLCLKRGAESYIYVKNHKIIIQVKITPSILSFGTSSMGNSFNYNNCSL